LEAKFGFEVKYLFSIHDFDNSYIPMLWRYFIERDPSGCSPMLRFRYALTQDGARRCAKNEFYLQQTPKYRGYTEKIFRALYSSEPLTIAEISQSTGIDRRAVNGVITFNVVAGYIRRIVI